MWGTNSAPSGKGPTPLVPTWSYSIRVEIASISYIGQVARFYKEHVSYKGKVAVVHRAAEKRSSRKLDFRCTEFSETLFLLPLV